MSLNLFPSLRRRAASSTARRRKHAAPRLTLTLESMESRLVLSAPGAAPAAPAMVHHHNVPPGHQAQSIQMLPLKVSNITASQSGQLMATVTLGSASVQVPVSLSLASSTSTGTTSTSGVSDAATTPILHLMLGPIDLNLLGLEVQTSKICLNIDAQSGNGNLLGNLLTDVANLLNNPSNTLGGILGSLSPTNLNTLTSGLTGLLNGALGAATTTGGAATVGGAAGTTAAASVQPGNILHLSLGPVDLNLLGLNVTLDNCAGGPVTVDVSAVPGPGNLLGNLLGDLAHLLDNTNAALPAINNTLTRIANEINLLV